MVKQEIRAYCALNEFHEVRTEMKERISKSIYRRLVVVKGRDVWWIDEKAKPNGIGPVCLFCKNLIDWGPTDHSQKCPVKEYIDLNEEKPEWL